MIYAVDFDGTLCENEYPSIGKEKTNVVAFIRERKKEGHTIILWTCRTGYRLYEAIEWCRKHTIPIDYVNENSPDRIETFGGDCRKISADFYIDDKNIYVK